MTELVLRLPDGQEISLPGALIKILVASADELSAGHAVTVLPSEVLLTPAEVGELLGLSRPFVARLIDKATFRPSICPTAHIAWYGCLTCWRSRPAGNGDVKGVNASPRRSSRLGCPTDLQRNTPFSDP